MADLLAAANDPGRIVGNAETFHKRASEKLDASGIPQDAHVSQADFWPGMSSS
jgi:hypothetical protein